MVSTVTTKAPAMMPLLSRGKHRNPRRGACLMELTSFLAGERWTDHPACTHPLVAALARLVNDNTSDAERQRLTVFVPALIGLTSDDPRWDAVVARRAAMTALPVAAEHRQRGLAVGILAAERCLDQLDGRPAGTLSAEARAVLTEVPRAWEWAQRFSRGHDVTPAVFHTRCAPSIVQTAVAGAVESCSAGRDALLREMLQRAIAECAELRAPTPTPNEIGELTQQEIAVCAHQ
jgi:hypothetical protein